MQDQSKESPSKSRSPKSKSFQKKFSQKTMPTEIVNDTRNTNQTVSGKSLSDLKKIRSLEGPINYNSNEQKSNQQSKSKLNPGNTFSPP